MNDMSQWPYEEVRMEVTGVHKAINAVQAALAKDGISKGRKNQAQGYSFRGIDDMYNVIAPHMAENGLVVLPKYSDRLVVERESAKGGALFYVTLKGDFRFVASDGTYLDVSTYGEAMDSGDKATNKAMSAALKYAFMQTFTIPTEGDNDSENQTHDVAPKATITPTTGAWERQSPDMQIALADFGREITNMVACGAVGAAVEAIDAKEETWWQDEFAKIAFWTKVDSKTRSTLKRFKEEAAMAAAVQKAKAA